MGVDKNFGVDILLMDTEYVGIFLVSFLILVICVYSLSLASGLLVLLFSKKLSISLSLFLLSISLISAFITIISFHLLLLSLFCSYFSRFLRQNLRLDICWLDSVGCWHWWVLTDFRSILSLREECWSLQLLMHLFL